MHNLVLKNRSHNNLLQWRWLQALIYSNIFYRTSLTKSNFVAVWGGSFKINYCIRNMHNFIIFQG